MADLAKLAAELQALTSLDVTNDLIENVGKNMDSSIKQKNVKFAVKMDEAVSALKNQKLKASIERTLDSMLE